MLDKVALPRKVWSLELLLDLAPLLDKQVGEGVAKSAYHQLRLVGQLRPFMEQKDLVSITNALHYKW